MDAGTSPSGRRTARPNLRVETLISIRFIAHRPSQSSRCAASQLGSATSPPPREAHPRALHFDPAAVETDLALGRGPSDGQLRSGDRPWRGAAQRRCVRLQHLRQRRQPRAQAEPLEARFDFLKSLLHNRRRTGGRASW